MNAFKFTILRTFAGAVESATMPPHAHADVLAPYSRVRMWTLKLASPVGVMKPMAACVDATRSGFREVADDFHRCDAWARAR